MSNNIFQYDGSSEFRSLADGLAKLTYLDGFAEDETAIIKTSGWSLRNGVDLGFASLLGPLRADRARVTVHLPPFCTFTARTTGGVRETFGIALLHNAATDGTGNVILCNEEYVHAVQFVPERSWSTWSSVDHEIVRCAVKLSRREQVFCRAVDEELLPRAGLLRYDALLGWRIKGSSRLLGNICQQMPNVSRKRVSVTLTRAGFELDSDPATRSGPLAFRPPDDRPLKITAWRDA